MSMTTHVIGFKPPDELWKKMKAVYDACKAADIETPRQVMAYFEWSEPDASGVEVKITTREYVGFGRRGFEIDIDSLPNDIKTIRFYNSW